MKKIIAALAVVVVALVGLVQTATAGGEHPDKVFVCKYVGTPGVDEVLQTGQNPISVSISAIPDFPGVGGFFGDEHARSLVLAYDTGQDEPSCPGGQGCEEDCTPTGIMVTAGVSFTEATCTAGPSFSLSKPIGIPFYDVEGLLVNGKPVAGESYTITALPALGYVVLGQAVFTHTFAAAPTNCGTPPPNNPPCTFVGADKDGGMDAYGGTNNDCAPRPTPPVTTTTTTGSNVVTVYVDRVVTSPAQVITKTVTKTKVKVKTKVVVKYKTKIKIKKVYVKKTITKCPKYTKLYKGHCATMGSG